MGKKTVSSACLKSPVASVQIQIKFAWKKTNSQKHHIQPFHPDCTLIYSNNFLWQWNIPCVSGQKSKASKQSVFTLRYLFRNTFNSYLLKSWTTRHVQEPCNSWGLWSINWSTGAANKHEQYHYHHTLLYLVDGTSLHNNGNYRFILRSPNQKTIMSSW